MNQEEIFKQLKTFLVETFELEPDEITKQSDLYEDLDIDSIDAVDLMVQLREITGKKVESEKFKAVRTIQDVLDTVDSLLNSSD
jgi:acyl carrier protein